MAPTAIPAAGEHELHTSPSSLPADLPINGATNGALNGVASNGNGVPNGNGISNGNGVHENIAINGSIATNCHATTNGHTTTNGYTTSNGHASRNGHGTRNGTSSSAGVADTTTVNNAKQTSIAIVGMGCRLPGDVSSPEEFWGLCSRARSGWSEMPKSRFNHAAFHHPNPDKLGCYNPAGGHFLTEDIALFDAPFFNMTEKEAISMDPQQRLLLECTFEALENGGIPKQDLAGQKVGVFVGGSFADYELNNVRDTDTSPMYQATGCASALLANRLSYYFDFAGPSFTVDTACSSSLTGLHLACQSLRSGESTHAIVASCHLNILPDYFVTMSAQRSVAYPAMHYIHTPNFSQSLFRPWQILCFRSSW
jgi:hypothetical protein